MANARQHDALAKARDLRTTFENYEIESRIAHLTWTGKAYDRLQRYWARVVLLCGDAGDAEAAGDNGDAGVAGVAGETKYYKIDLEGAYFAMMGGYTFCPVKGLLNPANELTLDPDALAFLLRQDFITTSELASHRPEITDKEKSDMLAKLLVCVQAVWMVFNCLSMKIAYIGYGQG